MTVEPQYGCPKCGSGKKMFNDGLYRHCFKCGYDGWYTGRIPNSPHPLQDKKVQDAIRMCYDDHVSRNDIDCGFSCYNCMIWKFRIQMEKENAEEHRRKGHHYINGTWVTMGHGCGNE